MGKSRSKSRNLPKLLSLAIGESMDTVLEIVHSRVPWRRAIYTLRRSPEVLVCERTPSLQSSFRLLFRSLRGAWVGPNPIEKSACYQLVLILSNPLERQNSITKQPEVLASFPSIQTKPLNDGKLFCLSGDWPRVPVVSTPLACLSRVRKPTLFLLSRQWLGSPRE